jgi:cyanophycinase
LEIPRGKLISIGGAEDKGTDLETGHIERDRLKFFELGILKRIVDEVGGVDKRIEVITTASSIPTEVGANYLDAFGKIGCINIGIISIKNREDAQSNDYIERIKNCDGVMFTGGDQLRLTSIYGGTDIYQILHDRFNAEPNFVIAGTSAGAMAMSNTMIYQGKSDLAHLKGEVKLTAGLSFVGNVIIDSHFDKRGRFNRLAQAIASNPQCTGIGLGEDTGVIITNGNNLEVVGNGAVVIVDGKDIKHTNITDVQMGEPIALENLRVNILVRGNHYHLKERKFFANNIMA